MKKVILIIAVITSLTLTSCGILPGSEGSDLRGTSWKLVSYGGKLPIEGKTMTANFDGAEVSGSASCNHYFGAYKIKGSQISIEGLGWTEMACMDPEGIMQQEQVIMSMLSNSNSFTLQGDRLEIITTSGEILIFEKVSIVE
ncbi:MAG: META domain-containing protein [Anaerolineales bacterium]